MPQRNLALTLSDLEKRKKEREKKIQDEKRNSLTQDTGIL